MIQVQNHETLWTARGGGRCQLRGQKGEILGFWPQQRQQIHHHDILTGYISATGGLCWWTGWILWRAVEVRDGSAICPVPAALCGYDRQECLDFVYDIKKTGQPGQAAAGRHGPHPGAHQDTGYRNRLIRTSPRGTNSGWAGADQGSPGTDLDEPTVGLDPKQIIEIRSSSRNSAGSIPHTGSTYCPSQRRLRAGHHHQRQRIVAPATPWRTSRGWTIKTASSCVMAAKQRAEAIKAVDGVKYAEAQG